MPAWSAQWIGPCFDPRHELGVFAYRRRLTLEEVPERRAVRVSADQRYRLFVNETPVAFGPQRGDERHWFYETVDLAPYLQAGENLVWALVWNFGRLAPMAQHTVRTGFVMEGEGLSTPEGWEVASLEGWDFAMMHSQIEGFYIDIGPGEILDGRRLADTHLMGADERLPWRAPHVISNAEERGTGGGGTPWMLIPRSIPPMRYEVRAERPVVRRGFAGDAGGTLEDGTPLDAELALLPGQPLLLDTRELLCAYPRLVLSGPPGAEVVLTYAEALWEGEGKGNRDEVAGKEMRGYQDRLILAGEPRVYEPLWWRTYRYLLIEAFDCGFGISDCGLTEGAPSNPQSEIPNLKSKIVLHAFDSVETGYPLAVESSFEADDPWVRPLWDVSLRTARRCAGETYFDCPYYEQLQYAGDTRIQALIGYYLGRDRDLQRNAVETLGWSLMDIGITQSRYPSRQPQVIPPFSLWWVMMQFDQLMYDRREFTDGDWYPPEDRSEWFPHKGMRENMVGYWRILGENPPPFWHFGDWVPGWHAGVPPGGGQSTMHLLTFGLSQMLGSSLVKNFRIRPVPDLHECWDLYMEVDFERADGLVRATRDPDWHPCEHSEALYRYAQLLAGKEPDPWPAEALERLNAARCTYYFSYYKHLAMRPDDYLAQLGPWKEQIESGLTTFAENPEPVRSDCHAWSAHPILGFFQIVAGITSVAPGWRRARIEPRPGSLRRFDARIAHPDGELRVTYEGERLTVDTPVEAEVVWREKRATLAPGSHML